MTREMEGEPFVMTITFRFTSESEKLIKSVRLPTFAELFAAYEGFKPGQIVVLPRGNSRPPSGVLPLGTREETENEREHHVKNDG